MKHLPWYVVCALLMAACLSRATVQQQFTVVDTTPGSIVSAPYPDAARVAVSGAVVVYLIQGGKIRAVALKPTSGDGSVILPVASVVSGSADAFVRVSHEQQVYRTFDCSSSSTTQGTLCHQICNWCTSYQNGQPEHDPSGNFKLGTRHWCCPGVQ
jgi:hypothetical protein